MWLGVISCINSEINIKYLIKYNDISFSAYHIYWKFFLSNWSLMPYKILTQVHITGIYSTLLNIITFTTNIYFSQRDGQVWEYHFEEGPGSLRRMTFCIKQHIFIYQKITLYQSLKRLEIFTSIFYSTFNIYNSFKIIFIHVYIYLNIKCFKQYFLTSVFYQSAIYEHHIFPCNSVIIHVRFH